MKKLIKKGRVVAKIDVTQMTKAQAAELARLGYKLEDV